MESAHRVGYQSLIRYYHDKKALKATGLAMAVKHMLRSTTYLVMWNSFCVECIQLRGTQREPNHMSSRYLQGYLDLIEAVPESMAECSIVKECL